MSIQSVFGTIEKCDLGVTLPHEHIFIDLTTFFEERPIKYISAPISDKVSIENLGILDRDPYAMRDNLIINNYDQQKRELLYFKEAGGKTIFDATTTGIGRNPSALKRLSEEIGLNIISGAGFYVDSTHSDTLRDMNSKEISLIIKNDLEIGMDGTDIRSGYIGEIGISETVTASERKVLKGAAIAQTETGVGLLIHINPWSENGIEAANIAIDSGVKSSKIAICHVDVENHEDYILKLLDKGVYVEFDNFGKEYYVCREARHNGYGLFVHDTERVKLIKSLIDRGYINQLLLSCDVCLKTLLVEYGGWGYSHILSNIVPMLEDEGVTKKQLDTMLIVNPSEFYDVKEGNC